MKTQRTLAHRLFQKGIHQSPIFFGLLFATIVATPFATQAQHTAWQQEIHYVMDIDVDAEAHQYKGTQQVTYINHSPDTLYRVYYHLYFNAFQPGSMMDVRSRTIADADRRVQDRIFNLQEDEIGYLHALSLTQNGQPTQFTEEGTVLVVDLAEPIAPGATTVFEMEMEAQVPLQIRRSGRDNAEGVEFSMAQWYPKMAAYDEDGWHPNPYIGREFYAPFGSFDVTIHMDRNYVVAAGAVLQNPQEVGHGYERAGEPLRLPESNKLTWKFRSENIHDFMWAADPDYRHTTYQMENGPLLRFFYQADPVAVNAPEERQADLLKNWEELPEYTARAFEYAMAKFGKYPYPEYSVIQGGDGGMEYIMGTLITGNRSLQSLVGVTVHEFMHSWYMGVLGMNESYYYWMDEGFTSYATDEIMASLFGGNSLSGYGSYIRLATSGFEEPLTTHADHFIRNAAYGVGAYSKGAVFLGQLKYIVGEATFDRAILRFFEEWKFQHPTGKDVLRIFERESNMVLDWYYEYFVQTTKSVDYAIQSVETTGGGTVVTLANVGSMPMPLDVTVTYQNGTVEEHYIPLQIMRGEKPAEQEDVTRVVHQDWPWVNPDYSVTLSRSLDEIADIVIDKSGRLADVNRENNRWAPEN
jgi:hypothetical protein